MHPPGKGFLALCWRSPGACERTARASACTPTDGELWSSLASPRSLERLHSLSPCIHYYYMLCFIYNNNKTQNMYYNKLIKWKTYGFRYHDVWQQGDKTSREKVPVRSVRIVLTPVSPGANAKLAPSRVPVCKPSLLISDCLFARCCKDGAPMLKQKGPDRGTGQGHPCRRDPIRLPRRCRRCGPRRRSRRRPDNGGRYCHEGQG